MIPAGRYTARAVDSVLGRTSNGNEQVAVTFEVLAPESQAGQTITWYGYFTEKTVDRTLESLEACGWDGESLANPYGIGSREVHIVIAHEPDEKGEMRARVRWVNKPGGAAVKERLDTASATALEQRLKGKLIARRQQRAANGGLEEPPF